MGRAGFAELGFAEPRSAAASMPAFGRLKCSRVPNRAAVAPTSAIFCDASPRMPAFHRAERLPRTRRACPGRPGRTRHWQSQSLCARRAHANAAESGTCSLCAANDSLAIRVHAKFP